MTIDKRINYRGGGGYRGGTSRSSRSYGPPGSSSRRSAPTHQPAPRATPVQNVHQTGAVTQTPGKPVQQLGTANQVSTAVTPVTTGGQSPFVHTRPQGITNIDRVKRMISSARNIPWSNLFGFSHAGAAELTDEELLIERAIKQKGKEKEIIGKIQGSDTTGAVEAIPDLTDPQVMSNIAVTTGMPTEKKKFKLEDDFFKTKLDYPTPDAAYTIKSIQGHKRPDDPADKLSPEQIIEYFGDEGKYKGMNLKEVQSIYDMVQLPNQRTLVANGGLINLFKYGGFLG